MISLLHRRKLTNELPFGRRSLLTWNIFEEEERRMTTIVEGLLGKSDKPSKRHPENPSSQTANDQGSSESLSSDTLSPFDDAEMKRSGVFWVGIGVALIAVIVILVVILLFCSDTSSGASSSYRSGGRGGGGGGKSSAKSSKSNKKSSNKHKGGKSSKIKK